MTYFNHQIQIIAVLNKENNSKKNTMINLTMKPKRANKQAKFILNKI